MRDPGGRCRRKTQVSEKIALIELWNEKRNVDENSRQINRIENEKVNRTLLMRLTEESRRLADKVDGVGTEVVLNNRLVVRC